MARSKLFFWALCFILMMVGMTGWSVEAKKAKGLSSSSKMSITSSAIRPGATVPAKYTCDGEGILPPLRVENVPSKAKSLAIIVDDPDAAQVWTHLIVWNLKPTRTLVIEEGQLPSGGVVGSNAMGVAGYSGPCPPLKSKLPKHRYFFKVYALDSMLNLPVHSKRHDLDKLMDGHVVGVAALMAVYERAGAVDISRKGRNAAKLKAEQNASKK